MDIVHGLRCALFHHDGKEAVGAVMNRIICYQQTTINLIIAGLIVNDGSTSIHLWLLVCFLQMYEKTFPPTGLAGGKVS